MAMVRLYVKTKEGEEFTSSLESGRLQIGRDATNDLVLQDPFSSSFHAVVFRTDGGFVLEDRGSKNGTFVNGRRITGPVELQPGDEILIGSTRISFDRDFPTRVEVADETTFSGSMNTIIDVREIVSGSLKPAVTPGQARPQFKPASASEQRAQNILAEVSRALIYHMPLENLLEHVMDLLTGAIPMDRAVLMLREDGPESMEPRVTRVRTPALRKQKIVVSRTIINTALERHSAILISDIGSDDAFKSKDSIISAQVNSVICVPLWNNETIIGLLYGDRSLQVEPFTEEDLRLLTLLANLAAVKYENAKLAEEAARKAQMERELKLAAQIQRNFLPHTDPVFEPFQASGGYKASSHVGGDYYDFIALGPDELGVVIADVSGTGYSAALLMASLRASIRTEAAPHQDLCSLARRLNDFVHASSEVGFFISFFFGVLDRRTGRFAYVNAGHNPPLLFGPEGGREELASTGLCLGMFPGVSFETASRTLEPGGLICLYTDGIIEQRNGGGEEYSLERLDRLLRGNADRPARELVELVFRDVAAFAGTPNPADDMTLVVIRRLK
jgi:serine phosphatase RsbU (regulator of sigma subunit)